MGIPPQAGVLSALDHEVDAHRNDATPSEYPRCVINNGREHSSKTGEEAEVKHHARPVEPRLFTASALEHHANERNDGRQPASNIRILL